MHEFGLFLCPTPKRLDAPRDPDSTKQTPLVDPKIASHWPGFRVLYHRVAPTILAIESWPSAILDEPATRRSQNTGQQINRVRNYSRIYVVIGSYLRLRVKKPTPASPNSKSEEDPGSAWGCPWPSHGVGPGHGLYLFLLPSIDHAFPSCRKGEGRS
jgi:hypothetical protein